MAEFSSTGQQRDLEMCRDLKSIMCKAEVKRDICEEREKS